ncbi:glycosyltransferase family 1 protein [Spirosoma harenae]
MVITYLLRSTGTGHSIEGLFRTIEREVCRQFSIQTSQIQLPNVSHGLWSIWQNMRFLKSLRSDIFHITGDVHYAALGLPASRVVLTIHDCSTLRTNRNRPIRYALFWLLWYYLPVRRARIVTVVSEKTRQELIRYVGKVAEKAVVIPNGYDPHFAYRPTAFRKEHPVLLQIGTASNKNVKRLIAAIEGISCTLILVGPLSNDVKQDLQKRQIQYRQYKDLTQAEVLDLYTTCDIVTFLSTYEGFGMPVLEANAVGRVVITSAIAPMAQLATEAAHFVDPFDVNAIRKGILRIIEDDAYRQSLIKAGHRNAQNYTVLLATTRYVDLYQKITHLEPTTDLVQ